MTCVVPQNLEGMIKACRVEAFLKNESEAVDRLYKSFGFAAKSMLVEFDPPPPADPIVEFLGTVVAKAISKHYYEIGDPIGVALDPAKWQQVVNAFTWTIVRNFYEREAWV